MYITFTSLVPDKIDLLYNLNITISTHLTCVNIIKRVWTDWDK